LRSQSVYKGIKEEQQMDNKSVLISIDSHDSESIIHQIIEEENRRASISHLSGRVG